MGFIKISTHSKLSKLMRKKTKRSIGRTYWVLIGLLILMIITSLVLFLQGKEVLSAYNTTASIGKEAYNAVKKQDLDLAKSKLKDTQNSLTNLSNSYSKMTWVGFIPIIGNYYKDGSSALKSGAAMIEAAIISTETLSPYADLLGLKGKSTFVSGSADERIKTAVQTLDKIIPNIDKISFQIDSAGKELDKINIERYPEKIGKYTIKSRLRSYKNIFSDTATLFVQAQPFLKKVPDLLGNNETKRYLLIFQNDAELRATGGFITAYAVFKVDKGKIQVEKADDIYKLDESKKKKYPAPPPILKYHKGVNNLELRDNNLSPDFMVSMGDFEKMLNDSVPDFPKFDGIISLDTHVLVSSIKILGDFNIYGRSFTAENDKRCDCPKAIYELEDYSSKPVAYVREERKDIIGVLMYQIMQRAFGVSPSKYWGKLFQMFLDEAKQKHVIFYFHDSEAQKGIEAVNFAGRINHFDGDYIHISDVNFAGAKSNLFVKHYIKQDYSVGSDGTVTKVITIDYKNPSPPSNCNLEAGQLCLNGILRNWVRVYVPKGSRLIEFNGSEKETQVYDELDKTVFEGFLTVKPQGTSEVKIKYSLPSQMKRDSVSKLLIQKQGGTDGYQYTLFKNGKELENFSLETDKTLQVRL